MYVCTYWICRYEKNFESSFLSGSVLKKIPDNNIDTQDAKSAGTFENAKMVRNWTPRF